MKRVTFLIPLFLLISCTSPAEVCKQVSYNSENAMNIILLPDGFTPERQKALGEYIITTIKEKEPFKSKQYFNVYFIENYNTSICRPMRPETVYGAAGSPLPPLNCTVEKIVELVNHCNINKGKIIVMTEDNVASQSSISYDESGVMFLDMKNQVPEVIQHEFGHLFGLVDEKARLVSYAIGPGREPAPNCVKTSIEAKWWSRFYSANHTPVQGCAGSPDWYTPEVQTLMAHPDPAKGYGTFNEWYLGQAMECCYAKNRTAYACEEFFTNYPQWSDCRE